jgi:hypothetical protein
MGACVTKIVWLFRTPPLQSQSTPDLDAPSSWHLLATTGGVTIRASWQRDVLLGIVSTKLSFVNDAMRVVPIASCLKAPVRVVQSLKTLPRRAHHSL